MMQNSTKNITIKKYSNKQVLFTATAKRCEQQLRESLATKSKASFIIPGGSTPGPSFLELSRSNLDWSSVYIGQSDERWVNPDHPQSNQKLTTETLLINNAKNANFVAMKNSALTAQEGETECNHNYRKMPYPFSLTMLGMGPDGHIASLFPEQSIINKASGPDTLNQCIAIDATGCEVAGDYPERMSLTFDALLNSDLIIILMIGLNKHQVLQQALKEYSPVKSPVSALLHQTNTPIEIHWCE